MYLGLSILGFLLTLSGAIMIAFGIPNYAFGLGNVLIIAGTVAFVGGFILVGIANAIKQLKQIAESLIIYPPGRPQIDDLSGAGSTAFARPPAASARIPFPPKPEPRNRAAAVPAEPPVDMAALDAALDQSAGPPAFVRAPGLRIAPEDETPLSPHAEPRFAAQRANDDALSEELLATAFARLEQPEKPESSERDEMLDPQWPSARAEASEPEAMELPLEARPADAEPKLDEPRHDEPKYDEPKYDEPKYDEPRYEEPAYREPAHEEPAQPADAGAISILKSGVIDGMAYTLYSDGAIEAEMPQGTMRFVSIDELRDYLEQTSG